MNFISTLHIYLFCKHVADGRTETVFRLLLDTNCLASAVTWSLNRSSSTYPSRIRIPSWCPWARLGRAGTGDRILHLGVHLHLGSSHMARGSVFYTSHLPSMPRMLPRSGLLHMYDNFWVMFAKAAIIDCVGRKG